MMQNALNHNNFMDFGNNIRRRHQGGDYSDDSGNNCENYLHG